MASNSYSSRVLQGVLERIKGAGRGRFHSASRYPERLGDLGFVEVRPVPKYQYLALPAGQATQCRDDFPVFLGEQQGEVGWRQRVGLGNPKMPAHDALTALGRASTVDHRGAKVGRCGRLVGEGPPTLMEGREGILDQLLGDGTITDRNAASRRRLSRCERYRPAIASFSAAISAGPASVTEPASPSAEPRTAVHLAPRQRKTLSLTSRRVSPVFVGPPSQRWSAGRSPQVPAPA
jgi:hypothetical protein